MKLIQADCLQVMKRYNDNYFDLAIVDPPYGININKKMMGKSKTKTNPASLRSFTPKDWDKSIPEPKYFEELFRGSKNQIIWGGNYYPLPLTRAWLFWDKSVPIGVSFGDGELAWTSFDIPLKKINIPYSGFKGTEPGGKIHPTQKPIALYRWILKNYAKPSDKILDTHLGSGTNAIACHYFGVKEFVGIEIDQEYFNNAKRKILKDTQQMKLFKL